MHGSQVLETLHSLPRTHTAAAMIRHAQRHALGSTTDPTKALLTDEGKAAARAMGAGLRHFEHLRLFHSPVERCRQTAECFAEGAAQNGLSIEILGVEQRLGFGYTKDMATACSMYSAMGEEFVARWFTGEVPDHIITPPREVAHTTLEHITKRLAESSHKGRRLDLHVSHDWNVMVMREVLLGVTHEQAGWLGFLDGISFCSVAPDTLEARYGTARAQDRLPWSSSRLRSAGS